MLTNDFQITEFSNDTRYTSAVAQVRVLESHLLPSRKFLRLSDKNNWQGVLDELRGTEYYETLLAVQSEEQLENAVSSFIHERHKRIKSLAIEPHIISAVMLNHDLNNLKIILKQKWNSIERNITLSAEGTVAESTIKDFLNQKSIIDEPFNKLIPNLLIDYEAHKSIFRIDMLISKFYLMNLYRVFINTKLSFLEHFIKRRIDLVNLLQVLRWKQWDKENLSDWDLIFAGGFLDLDFLKNFTSEKREKKLIALQFTPYSLALSEGLTYYLNSGELWMLEKLADDYMTKFCQLTQYTSFGVEPLVAYLWISLQELKNIHTILMSKYFNVDPDMIKKRLRITYG